ncbi:CLUMA_CG000128, isoform A [Clunio marinus]|uniref:CLUMA_CG000128, isoform A n=1 Tax=Clunio marinus TaxID=568069 RepID=A0A1J1HE88_9DIPT|nr:CLUMA_CG000128, isoform A [Clunio marinus]
MSFLKAMWNNNTKHKKLNDSMALASSARNYVESPLDFNDEELTDDVITFNLKYLGTTAMAPVEEIKGNKIASCDKKTQMISNAIKTLISTSKSQKLLNDVRVEVSPKGIETFDCVTDEQILQIPIYKISYCSIDAAHGTIFSFVSSTSDKEESSFDWNTTHKDGEEEHLVLHGFQCQKKKIAFNVTLTVARTFERAFQIYQNEKFLEEIRNRKSKHKESLESQKNAVNIKKLITNDDENLNCLIDLGSENGPELNNLCSKDYTRDYFQTTWVSFD